MRNKQIEEMADILCEAKEHDCKGGNDCLCVKQAEALYNAGYRKQSEWISVDERLPECRKFVIVCDEYGNVGEAYFYKADRKFEWVDDGERVFATHWMPLPKAPKMKGGAE